MLTDRTATTFLKLFAAAKAKHPEINAVKAPKPPNVANFDADTAKDFKLDLKRYGNELAEYLQSVDVKADSTLRALLQFIVGVKLDPEFFDCKEPLNPGDTTFDSIAGLADVKLQLRLGYIEPPQYPRLFPPIAKGTLFYGPPGTGKTMLARASTAEIPGAAFFAPSAGELKGKYEGETEKNIDQVFTCAQQLVSDPNSGYSFAIIFFDEFDSIAGQRGDDPGMTRSVNALLQAMDGINKRPNVSVVAATNYPRALDDAILRRFTTRIFVDLPDPEAIEYLVREALAMMYSPPDMTPAERRSSVRVKTSEGYRYNPNAPYMQAIAELGKFEKTRRSGIMGGTVIEDMYIDNDFVAALVKRFGPTDIGSALIERVNKGEKVTDDAALESAVHIFGYSPSDITKIMEMAIKFAGTRALKGYAYPTTRWDGKYWIAGYVAEDAKPDKRMKVEMVPMPEKKSIITFDIRRSDVEQAIKALPSTVDNEKYAELLQYAKQ